LEIGLNGRDQGVHPGKALPMPNVPRRTSDCTEQIPVDIQPEVHRLSFMARLRSRVPRNRFEGLRVDASNFRFVDRVHGDA